MVSHCYRWTLATGSPVIPMPYLLAFKFAPQELRWGGVCVVSASPTTTLAGELTIQAVRQRTLRCKIRTSAAFSRLIDLAFLLQPICEMRISHCEIRNPVFRGSLFAEIRLNDLRQSAMPKSADLSCPRPTYEKASHVRAVRVVLRQDKTLGRVIRQKTHHSNRVQSPQAGAACTPTFTWRIRTARLVNKRILHIPSFRNSGRFVSLLFSTLTHPNYATLFYAHYSSTMSLSSKVSKCVRSVLLDRSFTDRQIETLLPRLHPEHFKQPELLAETIDAWNFCMRAKPISHELSLTGDTIPATASPPSSALTAKRKINMNTILAEVEPDLLMFRPDKLVQRRNNIQGLGIINNLNQHWTVLFNAPRGFYLQDWLELTKKIYYIDSKVIDLLYDKKEQKEMECHPLVKSAATVEADFDHIRTRYLFAKRTGYRELSHLQRVQAVHNRPTLKDLILVEDAVFLERFAPFCSTEEYNSFANLIKNHDLDEDDAEICSQLAELESLRYHKSRSKESKSIY
jgi:hypothetical protein